MDGKAIWESLKNDTNVPLQVGTKTSFMIKTTMEGALFTLARYKFVVRMLANASNPRILELGCNSGFGTMFIHQKCNCESILGIDFDHDAIIEAKENISDDVCKFLEEDFLGKDYRNNTVGYDCVFSLDVIEHIPQEDEELFVKTITQNLKNDGFAVIGTPNLNMFPYASPWNKVRHINNYDQKRLYDLLKKHFDNVFIFGMNDEVLHTGFYPMSCYIMALCCGKKEE